MYEVTFNKNGIARRYVVTRFRRASELAQSVASTGTRVTIRRLTANVWIADPRTSEMFRIRAGLGIRDAFDWAFEVMRTNGTVGVMVIPSDCKLPELFLK
jgi:hypothetical protein